MTVSVTNATSLKVRYRKQEYPIMFMAILDKDCLTFYYPIKFSIPLDWRTAKEDFIFVGVNGKRFIRRRWINSGVKWDISEYSSDSLIADCIRQYVRKFNL